MQGERVEQERADRERVAAIEELWTDGDYAAVDEGFRAAAERLAEELDLSGRHVLDAAMGTGGSALAAARAGAEVHSFVLTPSLPFASAEAVVSCCEETSGPVQRMAAAFGRRWPSLRAAAVEEWDRCATVVDGGIELPATYPVATLTRSRITRC
jgi:hypothetical protein